MRFILNLQYIHSLSPIPEYEATPLIQDSTSPRDTGSDCILIEDSTSLRIQRGIPQ